MKLKLQVIVLSLVLFLGVSIGVYADSGLKEIKALLNYNLTFQLDSAPWQPKGPDGTPLTPITYENRTYLPVRAISEALKVAVDYDAVKNQVIIGEKAEGTPIMGERYSTADRIEVSIDPTKTTFGGKNYNKLFYIGDLPNSARDVILYPSGKYQKLFLNVGATGIDVTVKLIDFSGTNAVELSSTVVQADGQVHLIECPVTNIDALKVRVIGNSSDSNATSQFVILPTSYYK